MAISLEVIELFSSLKNHLKAYECDYITFWLFVRFFKGQLYTHAKWFLCINIVIEYLFVVHSCQEDISMKNVSNKSINILK